MARIYWLVHDKVINQIMVSIFLLFQLQPSTAQEASTLQNTQIQKFSSSLSVPLLPLPPHHFTPSSPPDIIITSDWKSKTDTNHQKDGLI